MPPIKLRALREHSNSGRQILEKRGSIRSSGPSSGVFALGSLDEVDRFPNLLDLFSRLIGNADVELFFEFHDQLNGVERVSTQIVHKGGFASDLVLFNTELLGHDFDHTFFDGSHVQSLDISATEGRGYGLERSFRTEKSECGRSGIDRFGRKDR